MAAYDALEGFVRSLNEGERKGLQGELKTLRAELLAARSEDARVRLVQEFIEGAREAESAVRRG
jgi:hypothetical protein